MYTCCPWFDCNCNKLIIIVAAAASTLGEVKFGLSQKAKTKGLN